jgi:hypothetical protein
MVETILRSYGYNAAAVAVYVSPIGIQMDALVRCSASETGAFKIPGWIP